MPIVLSLSLAYFLCDPASKTSVIQQNCYHDQSSNIDKSKVNAPQFDIHKYKHQLIWAFIQIR